MKIEEALFNGTNATTAIPNNALKTQQRRHLWGVILYHTTNNHLLITKQSTTGSQEGNKLYAPFGQ